MDTENETKIEFKKTMRQKSEKTKIHGRHIQINHDEFLITRKKNVLYTKRKQEGNKKKRKVEKAKKEKAQPIIKSSKKLKEMSNNTAADNNEEHNLQQETDENVQTKRKLPTRRHKKKAPEIEYKPVKNRCNKKNALDYIYKWKYSRNEWKFQKLKQIWLIDHFMKEQSIPDELFPIVLEYFEGSKGMARELLQQKGMKIVKKTEAEQNEANRDKLINSIAYKRARQLLQTLSTDT